MALAGNCSSLGAVSFYWYKTRGSALQLGTTSGGSDIINQGVTAPTWESSTGHFFNADTNDLHFYARIAPGVLGPSLQGQPYTLTGVDSKPQDVASPTVTKFPATLTTATVGPDNSLPFTPSWSGHIGAAYTLRPMDGIELTPRVNLAITTSQFFDAANTVEVAQNDTVTVLNTSVKLAAPEQGNGFSRIQGKDTPPLPPPRTHTHKPPV